jgi:4-hydroxy-tetrahydrodipicolinate synthase
MSLDSIRGVIPAIVTPFDENEDVDLEALERLTDWLVRQGIHGVMTTGGTGEFPHLDRPERRSIVATIVRAAGGRVPIIAGTAACSTREVVGLCEDAAEAGADAAITVPPYYFPLPEQALEGFFDEVAHRSPIPLFVYNNPLYTGNGMNPALLSDILERPNIVGLKQSEADLGQLVDVVYQIRVVRKLSKALFTGIDSQFLGALSNGADGVFSTAGGIVPAAMVEVFDLATQGRTDEARRKQIELQPLNRFLEYDPGYVAPAKEALRMEGMEVGDPRSPLPRLTTDERERLAAALDALGVLAAAT